MAHDFKKNPELWNSQMAIYYFDSPHKQIFEDFDAKVIKVIDGDTIRVTMPERAFSFPVRFIDTAAAEIKEGGETAQRFLESQILNKNVRILIDRNNRVGRYGRLLGKVLFNGVDMNEHMIMMGFSVPFENRKDGIVPDFSKELDKHFR